MLSPQQRSITRKLARIFECTRLLDLSRSDAQFLDNDQRAPGEIIYVVDTNFIQAFVQPSVWRKCSRLFHDFDVWGPSDRERKWRDGARALEDAISSQAVLVATEFVFSLALRGPRRQLLMSRPHQLECENQISKLEERYLLHRDQERRVKHAHAERISEFASLKPDTDLLAKVGVFWSGELPLDKMVASEITRTWENFVTASICQILAEDDFIEPREQLERLASDELWHISRLDWAFPIDQDSKEFKDQTQSWLSLLKQEREQRQAARFATAEVLGDGVKEIRLGRTFERTDASLEADASTLAHLHLIARNALRGRQRIVFITGDSLILNAYRRWYGYNGENTSYLMRPIAMYGPQYNLRDADSKLSPKLKAFEGARTAAEASTFPLTSILRDHYFEDLEERSARFAGSRARDIFCAEVEDDAISETLFHKLFPWAETQGRLQSAADELDSTAIQLRWLGRAAIGAVPHLVRKRVDGAIKSAQRFFDGAEANATKEGEIERWLAGRLTDAAASGFKFTLPYAVEWIVQTVHAVRETESRVGGVLRIELPFQLGDSMLPLRLSAPEWEKQIQSATREQVAFALLKMTKRPAQIFALASWLAFRQDRWSDAVRFADFASRSAPDDDFVLHAECQFLKAVSLRVRMMSDTPTPDRDVDVWRSDMEGAVAVLSTIVNPLDERQFKRRAIRARSERAAARLAYCAWAAVGDLGRLGTYRLERLDLRETFAVAVDELEESLACLDALENADDDGPIVTPTAGIRDTEWIRLQTALAPECARLVYTCLTNRFDPVRAEAFLPRSRAKARLDKIHRQPPLPDKSRPVSAVLIAYNESQEARFAKSLKEALSHAEAIVSIKDTTTLNLDSAMLALMKAAARKFIDASASKPISWDEAVEWAALEADIAEA